MSKKHLYFIKYVGKRKSIKINFNNFNFEFVKNQKYSVAIDLYDNFKLNKNFKCEKILYQTKKNDLIESIFKNNIFNKFYIFNKLKKKNKNKKIKKEKEKSKKSIMDKNIIDLIFDLILLIFQLFIFICKNIIFFIPNIFKRYKNDFNYFKKEYYNTYDLIVTMLIIFISLIFSEIVFIITSKTTNYLIFYHNANIPFILVIAMVYLFSAIVLGKFFAMYKQVEYNKYSKSSITIDFSAILGATSITLGLHLLLYYMTLCPIWFLRLVGFIFDLYLLQLIQFYFTPIHIFGGIKEICHYVSFKYPCDYTIFKQIKIKNEK